MQGKGVGELCKQTSPGKCLQAAGDTAQVLEFRVLWPKRIAQVFLICHR